MADIDSVTKSFMFNDLVRHKFPNEPMHRIIVQCDPIGDYSTTKDSKEYLDQMIEYRKELADMSDEEFSLLHQDMMNDIENSHFFNRSSSNADFDRWSKMPSWRIEEAVALSLGKDPKQVNSKSLKRHAKNPFAVNFYDTLDIASRALDIGTLADPCLPIDFVRWVKSIQLDFPNALIALVESRNNIPDWEEKSRSLENDLEIKNEYISNLEKELSSYKKALSTTERQTLLKMILGMAIDKYDYDPKLARNSTSKKIADSLLRSAISVNDDTIRKWLQKAKEEIDYDELMAEY